MATKTKLDLYREASEAAFETLNEPSALALEKIVAKKFEDAGNAEADFIYWRQTFHQCRQNYKTLKSQKPDSQRAVPGVPKVSG